MEQKKKIDDIFKKVLTEIKPDKLEIEAITTQTNELLSRLKEIVPKEVEIEVVGSIARGTNLRGDSDIDIFLLFNKGMSKEEITRLGLEYAKRLVEKHKNERYEIRYAEHPYARVYLDEYNIKADIVPAFKISGIGEMGTAVDRTPLHVEFINTHLTSRQKDDARLLKYLLKTHHIYGAESKVRGFSGYLCELLVYHFGSLEKLIRDASAFKLPLYIDPNDSRAKATPEIFKKFNSQFVVIDPVDKNRNVAAGVSLESLARFVLIAREFLHKPSIKIFYGSGFSATKARGMLGKFIKDLGLDFYLMVFGLPDKSEDITWPQLRKITDEIAAYAAKQGFEVYFYDVWIDLGNKGFAMLASPSVSVKSRMLKGPEIMLERYTDNFIKAHSKAHGILIKGTSIYALEKSKYDSMKEIMAEVAKGKLIKGRKDVSMAKVRLFVNRVPKEYIETVMAKLIEATSF